jgi:hypothetical protein
MQFALDFSARRHQQDFVFVLNGKNPDDSAVSLGRLDIANTLATSALCAVSHRTGDVLFLGFVGFIRGGSSGPAISSGIAVSSEWSRPRA